MSLIFPTGGKTHNWYGAEEGEKIGHQALSDEDLQGFVEIGEVDVEEGLPEEEPLEVAEEVTEEIAEESVEEPGEEAEAETVAEKVEEIKEELDELVEIAVTEGEDGALEIAEEEPLEVVTEPIEEIVEEELEECAGAPAMASSEEEPVTAEEEEPVVTAEDDEAIVVADVSGRWVKTAKLSPDNRKKVRDYWLMLGFPQDYVDAMVKDYE